MKQVKGVEQTNSATNDETPQTKSRHLFIKVETFNFEGRIIGTRIVDMYHFGTRGWLASHCWWAMHNGHQIEQKIAEDEEVVEYLAAQKQALADKFNNEKLHVAA